MVTTYFTVPKLSKPFTETFPSLYPRPFILFPAPFSLSLASTTSTCGCSAAAFSTSVPSLRTALCHCNTTTSTSLLSGAAVAAFLLPVSLPVSLLPSVCELSFSTISSETTGGVGGTCVLGGCVPKKLMVYASKYSHEFDKSSGFGWTYDTEPKHDWSTLMANKNAELQRLTGIYKNIFYNVGVT